MAAKTSGNSACNKVISATPSPSSVSR